MAVPSSVSEGISGHIAASLARRYGKSWYRDVVLGVRSMRRGRDFDVVIVRPAITSAELAVIPDELINELGELEDNIRLEDIVYGRTYHSESDSEVFYAENYKTQQRYERVLPDPLNMSVRERGKAERFYRADALWHFRFAK